MTTTRRDFLKTAVGSSTLLAFGSSVPAFLGRAALAAAPDRTDSGTILVVVQLSGGNDGLNTVVPYAEDEYARSRPTLRLSADRVYKIGSDLGFHPEMGALHRLLQDGYLSVVQGVGYPHSSRDHDTAMRHWHTARPDESSCPTGWIGRTIDDTSRPPDTGAPGVFVGDIQIPFALNAERSVVPSIRSLRQNVLQGDPDGKKLAAAAKASPRDPNPLWEFLRESAVEASALSRRVGEAIRSAPATGGRDYPDFALARTLSTVVRLLRAGIDVRIYFTEMGGGGIGGFDSHANQAGNHGALLRELSESIAAFVRDLRKHKLLERVVLMTFSEFGRTLAENGRHGTGHGAAAPMFLAGGRLRRGLIGKHPSLTDLDAGALRFHTDFRSVYATILDRWLGFDSERILGRRFAPVDLLHA